MMDDTKIMEDAVEIFSRYVQINTTNLPGNEMPAALCTTTSLRDLPPRISLMTIPVLFESSRSVSLDDSG